MHSHPSVRLRAYLPHLMHQRRKEQAACQGKSVAQIIREAVEQYLANREQESADPNDPLWQIPALTAGYPGSCLSDGAAHHDDCLYGRNTRS